ncbi:MAG: hypothetical protein Q7V63_01285 [Gammaproteobacteria bacterium]|nr:hypothetical protein [Gammaproteobacteria bacterium]
MSIVKPITSKQRKAKKQLLTQKHELNEYMRQPGFKGQLPVGQEDTKKQRDSVVEVLKENY